MGASWWEQVWLPLLIGVAVAIVVAALRIFGIRLWNCLMKLITTQTVGESTQDHRLPDTGAAAHENINGVPDLERGNGNGPAEGEDQEVLRRQTQRILLEYSESVTEPESGVVNSGEAWIEHFSNQEAAHAPAIQSPVTTPFKAQVAKDAATGTPAWAGRNERSASFRAGGRARLPLNEAPVEAEG